MEGPLFWVVFNAFILVLLVLDMGLLSKRPGSMKFKEAIVRSAIWVALAAGFAVLVFYLRGPQKALEFVAGYLVEESLSVDNLFVFLVLFSYFKVTHEQQRKVLAWGIVGALIMRGLFIILGVSLLSHFHWVIYIFGAFLIYPTSFKLLRGEDSEMDPEKNWGLKLARRWIPITSEFEGNHFFVKRGGRRFATMLFVCVLVVETTDVLFAMDSIPAVLAITKDPFIVYTSNVFAILGLRSLYFALAGMMKLFHHLHYGLAVILAFIGVKMLISGYYEISTVVALAVLATILALSIGASLVLPPKKHAKTSK